MSDPKTTDWEGTHMPMFMDFHDDLKLPPEAVAQIAEGTRVGATDEFGVRQVELYHNEGGKVYCLLEPGPLACTETAKSQVPRREVRRGTRLRDLRS